jgi:hypothetical protein
MQHRNFPAPNHFEVLAQLSKHWGDLEHQGGSRAVANRPLEYAADVHHLTAALSANWTDTRAFRR